jgi:uncharacterized membrane protein YccC
MNGFFETEYVIHGLKTAFACLVGYAITKIFHFYIDQWLIITILVVMCAQINVGSVIQKSIMRFLGTLTGTLIAALTLSFKEESISIPLVIACSALMFSYMATRYKQLSDVGTLGSVTLVIILINPHPTWILAAERFLEISIGILIAALVSQFIIPIHARGHLQRLQAYTLRQLRDFYVESLMKEPTDETKATCLKLDEEIPLSLIAQRKLVQEVKREPFKEGGFPVDTYKQLLSHEREIFRCISIMYHAYEALSDTKAFRQKVQFFHEAVCKALSDIADSYEKNHFSGIVLPDVMPLKLVMQAEEGVTFGDNRIYMNAFFFNAEFLILTLGKLMELLVKK